MSIIDKDWYNNKNILVTGGAGFIGSHLVDLLVQFGSRVHILDDLSAGKKANIAHLEDRVVFFNGSISDPEIVKRALTGIEIVFHLAANASVPRSVNDPSYDFNANAFGTFIFLDTARKYCHDMPLFVVASSGAVYGQPEIFPITEATTLSPISPYGASKVSMEAFARAFHSSFGMPLQIARIFNTYGPRQPRFVMYDFYHKLIQRKSYLEILGDGLQVRDFCYVKDTIFALLQLGKRQNMPCDVFNISSGKSYSIIEVAQTMIEIMGLKNIEFVFTGSSWAGDAYRWEVSIEKILANTNYLPRFTLDKGLREFITWADKQNNR